MCQRNQVPSVLDRERVCRTGNHRIPGSVNTDDIAVKLGRTPVGNRSAHRLDETWVRRLKLSTHLSQQIACNQLRQTYGRYRGNCRQHLGKLTEFSRMPCTTDQACDLRPHPCGDLESDHPTHGRAERKIVTRDFSLVNQPLCNFRQFRFTIVSRPFQEHRIRQ